MIKISVVVPTYNSNEENLNRILESFYKQTMNQEEFEVIFVDDGSSEFQSYKRIKTRIADKPNYFAYRVSPSGWASRPRNKGTKMARGEYVFFSDDDDTIFPQALEKMYNFAKENDLDVVNPKVIRTKGWSWGWEEYKENLVNAEKKGIKSMGPMTVPKLYRKEFLTENELYFSEGDRIWWEDVMFSCLVFSKNPKIGILADYPIYHWREQNRSASFGKDLEYKWSQLTNLALFFEKNLNQVDRDTMVTHWYKSRVLGVVRSNFHKKKEATQTIEFNNAKQWKDRFVNQDVINQLTTTDKILDKILELDNPALAYSLSESRAGITARSYVEDVSFEEDAILISTSIAITKDEEEKVKFSGKPGKVKIDLPKDVLEAMPKELHHYGEIDSFDNMYLPALHGRFTRTTWDVKDVVHYDFNYSRALVKFTVGAKLTFRLKLDDFIQDDEDKHQPWDVATRFSYLDHFSQRAIACKESFKKAAIINGETYVVYKNKSELLSIDLNSTIINFFSVAKIDEGKASTSGTIITLPITNVHAYGDSNEEYLASIYNGETDKFTDTTARVVVRDSKAFLELDNLHQLTGSCRVDIALGEKPHTFELSL